MPNRVRVLMVPDADRAELERRARSKGAPARVVERALIVLLAAAGLTGAQIAERAGCTEPTVVKWRRQYAECGLAGLEDAPRPGGPRRVLTDEVVCEILAATVTPPPESLRAAGMTHWSSRRLADWLGRDRGISVSHDSITVLWRKFCLQPHRTEGFKFSTDPQLEAKVRDVVGLYLAPPQNAVVVCVDEKPQIQALQRTRPVLPMRPGIPERHTHDYVRHGTTALFAALEVATGTVTDACYPRHRHGEFLRFLKKVAAAYPGCELRVVCDNYATHKHADVREWLARPDNQRITLHFVPTSCSWLNLVECFFSVITRQAIRRGTFTSVSELISAIGAFIDHWNQHPRPFTWTKDAGQILASIQRAKTKTNSLTRH
jgi:transposase